jgi:hypothetical protein
LEVKDGTDFPDVSDLKDLHSDIKETVDFTEKVSHDFREIESQFSLEILHWVSQTIPLSIRGSFSLCTSFKTGKKNRY